jgi:endo-1,4-beta-mannosidase
VLFSEFGNPECGKDATAFACLNENEMADYCTSVLERLQRRGSLGALWWCWADYDRRLADLPPFDRAPHELHFGIVRMDGSEKPVAGALAAFAKRALPVVSAPSRQFDETEFYASLPGGLFADYRRYRS